MMIVLWFPNFIQILQNLLLSPPWGTMAFLRAHAGFRDFILAAALCLWFVVALFEVWMTASTALTNRLRTVTTTPARATVGDDDQ